MESAAPFAEFHRLGRFFFFFFSTNVKEIEMWLVKSHAHPPQPRDTCGARVLFSFSAKINVICDILEGAVCQQENCSELGLMNSPSFSRTTH